jgi:hypothetical protein
MTHTITEAWLDGFVGQIKAAGFSEDTVPALLQVAGIVDAQRQNPAAFNQGFKEATDKAAGLFSAAAEPKPEIGLPDRKATWLERLPILKSYYDRKFRDRVADQVLLKKRRGLGENFYAGLNDQFTPGGHFRRARGNPFAAYDATE